MSEISRIQVQMIKQPTKQSCVHACLSMVTGIPVGHIIKRFGSRPLSKNDELIVLTEMGIYPITLPVSVQPLMVLGNIFMVTVPSLNIKGGNHAVVVEVTQDMDINVYDPSPSEHYPVDAMQPSKNTERVMKSYSEITLLEPLSAEHRGTQERIKLYLDREKEKQNE